MKGKPLDYFKKSWNGQGERRALLAAQGIELPDTLDDTTGKIPPDDILDAAATAWTAWRHIGGKAKGLPRSERKLSITDRGLIWY